MRDESLALQAILNQDSNNLTVESFFASIYQEHCGIFRSNVSTCPSTRTATCTRTTACVGSTTPTPPFIAPDDLDSASASASGCGSYHDSTIPKTATVTANENVNENPYSSLVSNGWNVLLKLLEEAQASEVAAGGEDGGAGESGTGGDARGQRKRTRRKSEDDDDNGEDEVDKDDVSDEDGLVSLGNDIKRTLLFQNQTLVPSELVKTKYGGNLFSAYLDGCSIVMNQSDLVVGEIAALCEDLQRSFPHAYANAYLTPPGSQAVPAHADDRDVLVIQLVGEKKWKVYKAIPVPYPYPHEQVGKRVHANTSTTTKDDDDNGPLLLPVPPGVYEQGLLIDTTLKAGDVLYMPRGYVHEASCASSSSSSNSQLMSFHVTVALATHDWTLAGLLSQAASQVLTSVVDFRKALPRDLGRVPSSSSVHESSTDTASIKQVQEDLDRAWRLLKEQITVESIHDTLKAKYNCHNQRVAGIRKARMTSMMTQQQLQEPTQGTSADAAIDIVEEEVVGPKAALQVTLETLLRYATPEEKASVVVAMASSSSSSSSPRGLHVRDEIYEPILQILQNFRDHPHRAFKVRELAVAAVATNDVAANQEEGGGGIATTTRNNNMICDLTLLAFARLCVAQGTLAVVAYS